MPSGNSNKPRDEIQRLVSVMAALRDPESGCPWDLAQTMSSLTRYTIEEAYEVADAIAGGEPDEICDELGDLLFQVVFYARLGEESGDFTLQDVARAIADKLERRHPHVFAGQQPGDASQLNVQWEAIKASERAGKARTEGALLLDDIPSGLPSLKLAHKMQKRCATVGFDWPHAAPVMDKVREELDEIQQELEASERNQAAVEEEIGDALFAMVNLARHCGVEADTALRKASHKFANRFNGVEELARSQQQTLTDMSLEEMEALWQQVKRQSQA